MTTKMAQTSMPALGRAGDERVFLVAERSPAQGLGDGAGSRRFWPKKVFEEAEPTWSSWSSRVVGRTSRSRTHDAADGHR